MTRRALLAVAAGTAVLCITQWGVRRAYDAVDPTSHGSLILTGILLDLLFAPPLLLPGLCAGWIAQRRGTLIGCLVGLIGSLTYSVISMAIALGEHHRLSHLRPSNALTWFWAAAASSILFNSVAGAAGQLLRSNNRWRGRDA